MAPRKLAVTFWLLLILALPGLENVATSGLGCEFVRTRLASRGETDFVIVAVQFVDAEHDLFLRRDRVHLPRCFGRVDLDRPRPAGGVLSRPGEAESVILEH